MGLVSALNALKNHLESNVANATVVISGNDPINYWDAQLTANFPTGTQRFIVLYAGSSTPTLETGNRFRREHAIQVNLYIRDDSTTTRGITLATLFDNIDTALRTAPGMIRPSKSESIDTIPQPHAGVRIFATINYCGGE